MSWGKMIEVMTYMPTVQRSIHHAKQKIYRLDTEIYNIKQKIALFQEIQKMDPQFTESMQIFIDAKRAELAELKKELDVWNAFLKFIRVCGGCRGTGEVRFENDQGNQSGPCKACKGVGSLREEYATV